MLANMANSLILHKRITTTTAKAKALRAYVEPIITKSKEDSTHSRRVVFGYLQNKHAVSELFREISPKIADRPGGYTRILKTGIRLGDNADMCIIELVDYNENLLSAKEEAKDKSTRRRRRGGSKPKTEVVKEEVKTSEPVIGATEVEKTKSETDEENADDVVNSKADTDEKKSDDSESTEEAKKEEK
jgi:large subunit ribosomal protein L17